MKTLCEALVRAAATNTGVRFVDGQENCQFCSYAELLARAQAASQALCDLGVGRGDVVAIILPTSPNFYDAFFGAMLLGAKPVALYPPMRLGRLQAYHEQTAACLKTAKATLIVTDGRVRRLLGETVALAQPALGCVVLQPQPERPPAAPTAVASADDTAFLQFSSGTTSAPKPVAFTHRQVLANIAAIAQRIHREAPLPPGTQQHSAVSWLPLYHDMGLVGCVLTALCECSTLTLIGPEQFIAKPALWLRTLSRYRATVSAAPNFAYNLCAQRIRDEQLDGVDLSAWQVALNGAETVSAATISRFAERFAGHGFRAESMTPVYGLAEAALAVTFSSPGTPPWVATFDAELLERDGRAKQVPDGTGQTFVSVGTPLEGYSVRIVGDDGTTLESGRKGHIHVSGPSVTLAPLTPAAPVGTAPLAAHGLSTGDTGFLFRDELFIVGRHKDLIIVRGRNIAPALIEESIDGVAGARVGCSVAVSHTLPGEATEALVVLVERGAAQEVPDDTVLQQRIADAVIRVCQIKPHAVLLLSPGTLPRTSSGKLRRRAALQAHLAKTLDAPKAVSWWRLTAHLARSAWAMGRAKRGRHP